MPTERREWPPRARETWDLPASVGEIAARMRELPPAQQTVAVECAWEAASELLERGWAYMDPRHPDELSGWTQTVRATWPELFARRRPFRNAELAGSPAFWLEERQRAAGEMDVELAALGWGWDPDQFHEDPMLDVSWSAIRSVFWSIRNAAHQTLEETGDEIVHVPGSLAGAVAYLAQAAQEISHWEGETTGNWQRDVDWQWPRESARRFYQHWWSCVTRRLAFRAAETAELVGARKRDYRREYRQRKYRELRRAIAEPRPTSFPPMRAARIAHTAEPGPDVIRQQERERKDPGRYLPWHMLEPHQFLYGLPCPQAIFCALIPVAAAWERYRSGIAQALGPEDEPALDLVDSLVALRWEDAHELETRWAPTRLGAILTIRRRFLQYSEEPFYQALHALQVFASALVDWSHDRPPTRSFETLMTQPDVDVRCPYDFGEAAAYALAALAGLGPEDYQPGRYGGGDPEFRRLMEEWWTECRARLAFRDAPSAVVSGAREYQVIRERLSTPKTREVIHRRLWRPTPPEEVEEEDPVVFLAALPYRARLLCGLEVAQMALDCTPNIQCTWEDVVFLAIYTSIEAYLDGRVSLHDFQAQIPNAALIRTRGNPAPECLQYREMIWLVATATSARGLLQAGDRATEICTGIEWNVHDSEVTWIYWKFRREWLRRCRARLAFRNAASAWIQRETTADTPIVRAVRGYEPYGSWFGVHFLGSAEELGEFGPFATEATSSTTDLEDIPDGIHAVWIDTGDPDVLQAGRLYIWTPSSWMHERVGVVTFTDDTQANAQARGLYEERATAVP